MIMPSVLLLITLFEKDKNVLLIMHKGSGKKRGISLQLIDKSYFILPKYFHLFEKAIYEYAVNIFLLFFKSV